MKPIERHETASWCNGDQQKELTNANVPDEMDIFDAKEWADENQK